jgi:hypothetical protein
MIFSNKIFSIGWHDSLKEEEPISCLKGSERIVSFYITFTFFEIEWWCLGDAFYGATEIRINKYWWRNFWRK